MSKILSKIQRKDVWLFVAQVVLLSLVVLSPGLVSYMTSNDAAVVWDSLRISAYWLAPALIVYLFNFYLFVPLLWFRHRFWQFGLVNLLFILICNSHVWHNLRHLPDIYRAGYSSFLIVSLLVSLMAICIALGIRFLMRQSEKKQREIEAELAWLKNQINPHFLFNTLNNISSLTQIDPDGAQDAIAQLSDLLRYAIYKTDKPLVPIAGEVEFMRNYIGLMQLRCNEKTVVNTSFNIIDNQMEVAPLLFISLIENAFKHGVSSNKPSRIDIRVDASDNALSFVCDNTNYPKTDVDRSGSGIGLENTRRRLELMYHDRYTWEQTLDNDIYHVKINIKP